MKLFPRPSLRRREKVEIINNFWSGLEVSIDTFDEAAYDLYFTYISETLNSIRDHEHEFAAQSIDGVYLIIRTLSENPGLSRNDVLTSTQRNFLNTSHEKIFRSIELAVTFWLGLKIASASLHIGPVIPGDCAIEWPVNQDLLTTVEAQFDKLLNESNATSFGIDHSFTYERLLQYRQVKINWTDNLVDHLKLEGHGGQRVLWVYQHRIALENHLHCAKNGSGKIIKPEVLSEAIRTLDLLFPYGDPRTAKLLARYGRFNLYVPPHRGANHIQSLSDFQYWNGRLAQLLNLYHGPPESKWQYFRDQRNFGQWASLWVAIFLIAFLTVVFGILSTYYTAKSARLTEQANWIAIAASCIENPNATIFNCDMLNRNA